MKSSLIASSESFKTITKEIGFSTLDNVPENWQSITQYPLLILVGLTGVGKTTVTNGLLKSEFNFHLLPNRRTLTDKIIFPTITNQEKPIVCRLERLQYTRQYQKLYLGGMADILSKLKVKIKADNSPILIFDGLRGENEVTYAAQMLPHAQFLILEASDHVRLQRLINRRDAFDYINHSSNDSLSNSRSKQKLNSFADLDIPGTLRLLNPIQQQEWLTMINQGKIEITELENKLRIILKEKQNYDIKSARNTLLKIAPERTLAVNTARYSCQQISQMIIRKMKAIMLKQWLAA